MQFANEAAKDERGVERRERHVQALGNHARRRLKCHHTRHRLGPQPCTQVLYLANALIRVPVRTLCSK
jgi:uncharacterized protein (DUF2235 family)